MFRCGPSSTSLSLFRLVEKEGSFMHFAFIILLSNLYFSSDFLTTTVVFFVFPIGGCDKEEKAARAYDLAALKY